jgi:outer membrane receptor for ferrienterochelin and colicins
MRWPLEVLLALLAMTGSAPALAQHGRQADAGPAARIDPSWDFTLPLLDGSRFVQASRLNGPVLVNFWGKDCAPCITEMPRLQAFAKANPHWTVLLVSTDAPAEARTFVQRQGLQLTVLRPGTHVGALMRSAGNRGGGLPFTVSLRDARICHRHLGELGNVELAALVAACAPQQAYSP